MYKIFYAKSFEKDLRKLPVDIRKRIVTKIRSLSTEPRQNGSQKLRAEDNLYRVRVGSYRVIYKIEDDKLVVIVISTGHRKEIYKKL